jgi:hypothetical protein
MATLLSGVEPVSIEKLLPNGKDESVTKVVRGIARRAQANAEEKGLRTLFVALGMATWTSIDSGRPADAAVLLFPVALEAERSHSFFISRAGRREWDSSPFTNRKQRGLTEHGQQI